MEKYELPTFESVTSVQILMLKLITIIPFDGRSYDFIYSRLLLILNSLCGFTTITIFINYGRVKFREGICELDFICETIVAIGLYLRYALLYHHRVEVVKVLRLCEDIWSHLKTGEKHIVEKFVKRMNYFYYFFLSTGAIVVLLYVVVGQVSTLGKSGNETIQRILPGRFYVDVQESPLFEMTYVFLVMLIMNGGIVSTGVDLAAPFLIMMSCGYLKSLRYRLSNILQSEFIDWIPKSIVHKLAAEREILICVRFHQMVLE